jgi:4-hydroxybenzoate polyprenyltransferase
MRRCSRTSGPGDLDWTLKRRAVLATSCCFHGSLVAILLVAASGFIALLPKAMIVGLILIAAFLLRSYYLPEERSFLRRNLVDQDLSPAGLELS